MAYLCTINAAVIYVIFMQSDMSATEKAQSLAVARCHSEALKQCIFMQHCNIWTSASRFCKIRSDRSLLRVSIKVKTIAPEQIVTLKELANQIRIRSLQMVHRSKLGHPGGDFSAADILVTLYKVILRVNPANPLEPERDRFIMSKGHCSASLYATL